jgi:hypothetical protein
MRPIRFCAGVNCSAKLGERDESWLGCELPLCPRCWRKLTGRERAAIAELAKAGHSMPARALAALVAELPVRTLNVEHLEYNRTWETVRANVADVLARQELNYADAVGPWQEFLEALFWAIGGTTSLARWSHVELACALVRSRTGIDGYEPYLIAAAVDLDGRLAGEERTLASAGGSDD